MFNNKIHIKKSVVSNKRTFVVAEISANHCGSLTLLKKMIIKLKKANVDAIKIQAYEASTITLNVKSQDFKINSNNTWAKYHYLYDLYKKAQTPFSWYEKIFKFCNKNHIIVFASIFDYESLKKLEKLKCPAYKVASPEITDIPLIFEIAKTKKPIIISSGLSNYKDLDLAVKTVKKAKNKNLILLKCTSSYPAELSELNLNTMKDMKKKFKCLVGYSDHTKDINVPIHASSMGAVMLEKHVMLKKTKSVDSFFSIEINKFKKMISIIRQNEKSNGKIDYNISKNAKKNLNGRRSLYVSKNIKLGEKFTVDNIKSVRPSFGLHPKYLKKFLNKETKKNLFIGDRLKWEYLKK